MVMKIMCFFSFIIFLIKKQYILLCDTVYYDVQGV